MFNIVFFKLDWCSTISSQLFGLNRELQHRHTTHPPLSSCGEVTVHRAMLPVSHGTGSRMALWAMGGLADCHETTWAGRKLAGSACRACLKRTRQSCHHTERNFSFFTAPKGFFFLDVFYSNTKITDWQQTLIGCVCDLEQVVSKTENEVTPTHFLLQA